MRLCGRASMVAHSLAVGPAFKSQAQPSQAMFRVVFATLVCVAVAGPPVDSGPYKVNFVRGLISCSVFLFHGDTTA